MIWDNMFWTDDSSPKFWNHLQKIKTNEKESNLMVSNYNFKKLRLFDQKKKKSLARGDVFVINLQKIKLKSKRVIQVKISEFE